MELLKWLFRQVFSLKIIEWIRTADMPWLGRIHMTFSSSLIIISPANIGFMYFVEAKRELHFWHSQGTKITRVVVQCSEAWTKRITTAVACLREKLQSCLPNLYQKHSKNCEISKHFKKPILFWDSWPVLKTAEIVTPVHTLVPFPFKQSPYILLKLLPRINHLEHFP